MLEDAAALSLANRSPRRLWLVLFAASLALRLVAAWPAIAGGSWPAWDEAGYMAKAEATSHILGAWTAGHGASTADLDQAYGDGVWPPLHPLLLGLALWIGGGSVAAARLLTVLVSAATTPLVERLGRRCGGARTGLCAAVAHLIYPSFVGFAHLLWSETFFVAFVLGAILLCLEAAEQGERRLRLAGCAAAGALLGAAALTRAAVLPFLAILPLWLALTARGWGRLWRPLALILPTLLLIAPWEWTLYQRQGEVTVLSSANGYNLLLGQFPFRLGEGGRERKQRMNSLVRARAEEDGTTFDRAARSLAAELIRDDPQAFLRRSVSRVGELWGVDSHLLRHGFAVVYPPRAPAAALALWGLLQLSFPLYVACAIRGLAERRLPLRHRPLFLALIGLGMLPPLVSVSSSRMSLPLLALLLPAVGHGLASLRERPERLALASLAAALIVFQAVRGPLFRQSSSLYGPAQAKLSWLTNDERPGRMAWRRVGDRVLLRARDPVCDEMKIHLRGAGSFFADGEHRVTWHPDEAKQLALTVYTAQSAVLPRLEIRCAGHAAPLLTPVAVPAAWHRWQPLGSGVEMLWIGGAEVSPTPFDERWPLRGRRETAGDPGDSDSSARRRPASAPPE